MSGANLDHVELTETRGTTLFTKATRAATDAGQQIATSYLDLTRRERLNVVNAFRRQLIAPGKPGRKLSSKITAAQLDWKQGMRGIALYRKHIRGWDLHHYWRRKVESRALMDAIRTRERRERKLKRCNGE